jgi:hypothetical protein
MAIHFGSEAEIRSLYRCSSAIGLRTQIGRNFGSVSSAVGCGFNWSIQHLVSICREEDVADEEVPTEDSFQRASVSGGTQFTNSGLLGQI